MKSIHRMGSSAVIMSALLISASCLTQGQTVYVGNSLTVTDGAPDGGAPLVILGEYDPGGPLANATAGTTLPSGTVKDVRFYGQNYNFTLYALAYIGPGPHTNEQGFQVVASEHFSGSNSSPATNTIAAAKFFPVNAGNLLAFAGQGPYYPQEPNDAAQSDATYESVTNPGSSTATPPAEAGSEFIVGTNADTNATYGFISDAFGNQGRTYGFGVDVSESSPSNQVLPVYQVTQSGATLEQAMQLARYLGIATNSMVWSNGMASYIDPTNFMAVPYVTITNLGNPALSHTIAVTQNQDPSNPILLRAIDFGALTNLPVFDTNIAVLSTSNAFTASGLLPQFGAPGVFHTFFTAIVTNQDGSVTTAHQFLDTQVNYQFSLPAGTNNYPLVGAGAHAQVAYGPTGNVTLVLYSAPQLVTGPGVQIISPLEASNRVAGLVPANSRIFLQLVYFAPPLWRSPSWPACTNGMSGTANPTNLIPWYLYGGTFTITNPASNSADTVVLKGGMIPATDDPNYVPSVNLSVSQAGAQMNASALVTGGSPPYTYVWSSSAATMNTSNGASISYTPIIRVKAPPLAIAYAASNSAFHVQWPISPGFVLDSITNLQTGNWIQVNYPVSTNAGMNMATISAANGSLFLRLRLPNRTLSVTDTVSVAVTDANGTTVYASQSLEANAQPISPDSGDPPAYGTESPYDTGDFGYDTGFWFASMQRGGGQQRFPELMYNSSPGDFAESLAPPQTGWLFPLINTNDPVLYLDADVTINTANIVYYTGHGNSNLVTFTWFNAPISTDPANPLIVVAPGMNMAASYNVNSPGDPNSLQENYFEYGFLSQCWGSFAELPDENPELDWLVVDACSTLQYNTDNPNDESSPTPSQVYAWDTWGGAFNGMHSMLGYANESFGGFGTAGAFADMMLGNAGMVGPAGQFYIPINGPLTIAQSWFTASVITQPTGFLEVFAGGNFFQPAIPAAMGPIVFDNNVSDYWDYYLSTSKGSGLSIPASQLAGWWYVSLTTDTYFAPKN